jgi:RNA polymerase sigma factor (TIGR02999 family)
VQSRRPRGTRVALEALPAPYARIRLGRAPRLAADCGGIQQTFGFYLELESPAGAPATTGESAQPDSLATLIAAADRGDRPAADALFAVLYRELHGMARRQLSRGPGPLTLGATTLLHEAYLVLAEREKAVFPDRARFMAYAARVMRGLIIDHVRARRAQKRGGAFEITSFETALERPAPDDQELARISEALDGLTLVDPALAQVVDLRYFCGFSFAEIAALYGVSSRTAQRQWEKARIYLHGVLRDAATL